MNAPDVYNPLFDALKQYGAYLVDKETAAKIAVITQDPTESEFVKGFNRGELAAATAAYTEYKTMLTELLK